MPAPPAAEHGCAAATSTTSAEHVCVVGATGAAIMPPRPPGLPATPSRASHQAPCEAARLRLGSRGKPIACVCLGSHQRVREALGSQSLRHVSGWALAPRLGEKWYIGECRGRPNGHMRWSNAAAGFLLGSATAMLFREARAQEARLDVVAGRARSEPTPGSISGTAIGLR
jgi:hypothetical protein